MSVLIKGIEMPKTCGDCRFSVDGWCYAIASNDEQPGYIKPDERSKWCPLVPVPPHGRLIDADLFSKVLKGRAAEELNQHAVPFSWSYAYECLNDTVGLIPTVIPADKDGET